MLLGVAFVRSDRNAAWPLRATGVEILAAAAAALLLYASPLFPPALRFGVGIMPGWALVIAVFAFGRGAISVCSRTCVRAARRGGAMPSTSSISA